MSLSMALGIHTVLELTEVPFASLNSTAALEVALRNAVDAGDLTLVQPPVAHAFPELGASAIALLAESHLSIHTWPEHGYAAVDLFTCNSSHRLPCAAAHHYAADSGWLCDDGSRALGGSGLWAAVQALTSSLGAQGARLTWLERGLPAPRRAAGGGGTGGESAWRRWLQWGSRGAPRPGPGLGVLGGLEAGADAHLRAEL